jgi:hypothetical protein
MKINIVVALYRDAYFHSKYGSAVRDLQFLMTLRNMDHVEKLTVINRPVSIPEIILLKKKYKKKFYEEKINTINKISYDFIGPFKGRSWADKVYPNAIEEALTENYETGALNVFLDFLPIGTFSEISLEGWFYWYDVIDNFTKHNRFSDKQKKLVQKKYDFVSKHADLISAVSQKCLINFSKHSNSSSVVIPNRLFEENKEHLSIEPHKCYDFGFIGFVTNKLDIEFLKEIAVSYTIAIYGDILDKKVYGELNKIKNLCIKGKFNYRDILGIISTFKVGLLPYKIEKEHDGSPLKLYEYMKYNRPCITSIDYEVVNSDFIYNYKKNGINDNTIKYLFSVSGKEFISASIKEEWKLKFVMNDIVDLIQKRANK